MWGLKNKKGAVGGAERLIQLRKRIEELKAEEEVCVRELHALRKELLSELDGIESALVAGADVAPRRGRPHGSRRSEPLTGRPASVVALLEARLTDARRYTARELVELVQEDDEMRALYGNLKNLDNVFSLGSALGRDLSTVKRVAPGRLNIRRSRTSMYKFSQAKGGADE